MQYSLTLVIKNDLPEKERDALLLAVNKNFDKVLKEEIWGMRSLAYPIKHQTKAFYAHYEFEAEPGTIPSLDKSIKLDEDVIRYLLVKREPSKKKVKVRKPKSEETVVEDKA